MSKTETIHTRVTPEIKKQAEAIFQSVGLTTSQAIALFLVASVNHNGIPFELSNPTKEQRDINFANAVAKVDGVAPSRMANNIISSYLKKDVTYETAIDMIKKMYKPV